MTDYTPFPVDCLPSDVRRFVVDQAKTLRCDQALVALPALSALASAIGAGRFLVLKPSWLEPAVLWTAVVADSGNGASSAFQAALRPLAEFERSPDCTGQGDRRTQVRTMIGDLDMDPLIDQLRQFPQGLLMAQDGLDGWLSRFDRRSAKGRADQSRWYELHGAARMTVDQRQQVTRLDNPALSIAGTLHPRLLVERYKRVAMPEPLFGRLLFAYPPRKPREWTSFEIDPQVVQGYRQILARLRFEHRAPGQAPAMPVLVEPEALELFADFVNEVERESVGVVEALRSTAARLESCAARLALVIHLTRQAQQDPVDGQRCDRHSMQCGITLARWFAQESRRLHQLLHPDEAQLLLNWLRDHGRSQISARDLCRENRRYRTSSAAQAALDQLVAAGLGEWIRQPAGPAGGRPTSVMATVAAPSDWKVDSGTVEKEKKAQRQLHRPEDKDRNVDETINGSQAARQAGLRRSIVRSPESELTRKSRAIEELRKELYPGWFENESVDETAAAPGEAAALPEELIVKKTGRAEICTSEGEEQAAGVQPCAPEGVNKIVDETSAAALTRRPNVGLRSRRVKRKDRKKRGSAGLSPAQMRKEKRRQNLKRLRIGTGC